ncbi:hypothetical protein Tco_1243992 [Tanacetum coccineum]
MIKIYCNGDIFSEEQHFELSSERAADYVKKESILDLGGGNIRVSVKTEYGKIIVFKIESSRDIDNVKVIKQAHDESAFELLFTLLPKPTITAYWLLDHDRDGKGLEL